MNRRQLAAMLVGAAAGSPLNAFGQPTSQGGPIVGWIVPVQIRPNPIGEEIVAELARLGWINGKTITLDVRDPPPDPSQIPRIAAELVARPVGLILAPAPPAAAAAQRATHTIPIVALADDMQASGLVSNIARPGGNTTGVSIFASELDAKRLALLAELVPSAHRIAVLSEAKTGPTMTQLQAAAQDLHISLEVVEARNEDQIDPALDAIVASRVDAVNVLASVFFHAARRRIVGRLETARLPAIYQWPEYTREEGALIAYGPRQTLVGRLVARQVDRVLRGSPPGDLPVIQPTKFDLSINVSAAKKLGLAPSPALLARADELVE